MLDRFAEIKKGLERVAYLDGVRFKDHEGVTHGAVTTLVLPRANLRPRNYEISSEAMAEAGRHLHPHGLARLVQVHTHGNDWVDHSPTDDAMAFTRRPGAISIVLPWHATYRPSPGDGGVHERRIDGWHRLTSAEAAKRVQTAPGVLDFRPSTPSRETRRFWPWKR